MRRNWCGIGMLPMLLVLVALRLGDPFACLTHCWLWLQAASEHTRVTDQPSLVHSHSLVVQPRTVVYSPCIQVSQGAPDLPSAPLSMSSHEHWAALMPFTFLVVVLMVMPLAVLVSHQIRQPTFPPLLRPPIIAA